ncbi:MAG: hypothetical protein KF857_06055 [Fimbriimonadaceae bacterium]|nr:hypothetical protein [Fimbriimonadaceae bacterium]
MPRKVPDTPSRRLTSDDLKRLPWRSIGPASMGGRVADLCFKPGDTKTYYVAYASGGLWRTTNMGTTFEPVFEKEETSSVGSVVCCDAPVDWKGWDRATAKDDRKKQGRGKIVWVGTGEGNGRNSSSWGHGVYRSTDGGKTWTHLGLEDSHDIPRLAVDPRDPDVCYVAALGHLWGANATRGLYKTVDGGATWTPVLQINDQTGCCDVILDPKEPDTVYAAMYDRRRTAWSFRSGGPEGGIYKSTDGGKTWKKLAGGLPGATGRIGLDIYAGDTKKLVAVVESTQDGANSIRDDRMRGGGVFRSDDGGATWVRKSHRSPRAFYFSKVKFDPKDDSRVYMLGWTTEVSDDGGDTFRSGVCNILHADHHAILVSPVDSDHLVIGTDGGVYQSFDKGATWDFLNTMATGQFYNLGLDMSEPYRIIGGLQDNGTWVGPSATNKLQPKDDSQKVPATSISNADWYDVFWGDGFHAAFDTEDHDVVYAEWQGGHITRVNIATGDKRYLSPEAREGESRHRYNWNSPFFISPHDGSVIYHAGNKVFKLTGRGARWACISPDLTTNDPAKMDTEGSKAEAHCTLVSLAESPVEKGVLWAGSDDGLVHVTVDDGKAWANVTPAQVGGLYISRIEASHHAKGRAYVSVDGHRSDNMDPLVLATDDYGRTWRDITSDLPKGRSVKCVREDRSNPDVLYVGTEKAVYLSLDRGTSWVDMRGKALPTVPVDDIQQHPRETDLVLGTHGRSIWILDGAAWISELTPEVLASPLHLFKTPPARPQYFIDYPGLWTHKVFRAANPPTGVRIDYWVGEYQGEDIKVSIEDAGGNPVKSLSGSGAPGYNRVTWDLVPEKWLQLADKGEEPMLQQMNVRPGVYTVKLTLGEHKAEGKFEVLPLKGS